MGSSASKAARTLPKRVNTPSWAGARTPSAADINVQRPPSHDARASERKTEDIQRDSIDPDFIANLNRLGPVRIDHHHTRPTLPVSEITPAFSSRRQSEEQQVDGINTKNRLPAYAITELLDARKSITSSAGLDSLTSRYNIDIETLERVARTVSSPSVDPSTMVKKLDEDGEESFSVMAVWVEPQIQK